MPDAFDGQNILLYKNNGFGLIRNTERGPEVTENASETTIATALVLASQIMNHQPLIINGSEEFKKEVLKTVVLQDLSISFDNMLDWIYKSVKGLPAKIIGEVSRHSALEKFSFDKPVMVSSDPPYYDNIGYANLSEFFMCGCVDR